jgi:hypothetical protein
MPKRKTDGSYVIVSESHVQAASAELLELEAELEVHLNAPHIVTLREDIYKLTESINAFVVKHYEASDGYEDQHVRFTKVVGHTRRWNPDKLIRLLPTSLYKLVIDVKVNADRLDALVKEGKINRKKIAKAFEETPNAPYVKRTDKSDRQSIEQEAAKLKEALG